LKKNFTHINENDRKEIDFAFNVKNKSIRQIAFELKKSPNTISREIKLNSVVYSPIRWKIPKDILMILKRGHVRPTGIRRIYHWKYAEKLATERQKNSHMIYKINNNPQLKQVIIDTNKTTK
jgi:IS30 family transposase